MKVSDIEVSYVDHMGTDLSVVNAARVSFAKGSEWDWKDGDPFPTMYIESLASGSGYTIPDPGFERTLRTTDVKLINYLAKHKHYSPFNHTFLSFRIKAPVYAARQLVKHEYMPWNEVSRRYVDDEPEFYMPELRGRAVDKKQGSLDTVVEVDPLILQTDLGPLSLNAAVFTETALEYYKHLIAQGVAPEVARGFLPHTLMTEWIWSGTLKAFHKMLSLRLKPDTQKEARIVAEKIAPAIEELFPVSFPALMSHN